MKKIILSLVFVFATGIVVNADSKVEKRNQIVSINPEDECSDLYFAVRDFILSQGFSLNTAIMAAIKAEEECFNEIIEIIE